MPLREDGRPGGGGLAGGLEAEVAAVAAPSQRLGADQLDPGALERGIVQVADVGGEFVGALGVQELHDAALGDVDAPVERSAVALDDLVVPISWIAALLGPAGLLLGPRPLGRQHGSTQRPGDGPEHRLCPVVEDLARLLYGAAVAQEHAMDGQRPGGHLEGWRVAVPPAADVGHPREEPSILPQNLGAHPRRLLRSEPLGHGVGVLAEHPVEPGQLPPGRERDLGPRRGVHDASRGPRRPSSSRRPRPLFRHGTSVSFRPGSGGAQPSGRPRIPSRRPRRATRIRPAGNSLWVLRRNPLNTYPNACTIWEWGWQS